MTYVSKYGREATTDSVMERESDYLYEKTVPNLCDEFRETIRGLIARSAPETVTHALLQQGDEPLTREGIAAALGRPTFELEGVLAALEEEAWVVRFTENSLEKYLLQSPHFRRSHVGKL